MLVKFWQIVSIEVPCQRRVRLAENTMASARSSTASSIWQRPFVDVFKLVGLSTGVWSNCEREGNVKQVLDKAIGKNVVRVAGAVATANTLQIPSKKHTGLGLTGSFIYVQVRPLPHQLFTIIIEVLCKDGTATRITLSNMFRVYGRRGPRILVPLDLADEWYTVGLDVPSLLDRYKDPARPSEYWCLKSITVHAGVQLRNVYTSETPYRSTPDLNEDSEMVNLESMPSAMQMSRTSTNMVIWAPSIPQISTYSSATSVPIRSLAAGQGDGLPSPLITPDAASVASKDVFSVNNKSKTSRFETGQTPMSNSSGSSSRRKGAPGSSTRSQSHQTNGSQKFSPRIGLSQRANSENIHGEGNQLASEPRRISSIKKASPNNMRKGSQLSAMKPSSPSSVRNSPSIASSTAPPALRPDPIMRLHTYVGHSCALDSATPIWSRDGKSIIYASACNIIIGKVDNPKRQQRMLFGHTARVNCLALDTIGSTLASSQDGRNPVIRLWDTESGRCTSVLATCPGGDLRSLDFSSDGSFLCAVGRDEHNRMQLCVWSISGVQSKRTVGSTSTVVQHQGQQGAYSADTRISLVARQTCEFDIARVRFSPYDAYQLVSGGRENIRFWRIRNRHLPGTPVVLNDFARKATFTDLAFESSFGGTTPGISGSAPGSTLDKRVFFATNLGTVMAVHYERRAVLCIYRLHDGPIHAIAINEGFCVTASEDQHVRVWPLDFGDFFLEARHESPVGSVDVSPDGLEILTNTIAGVMGVLHVSSHSYTAKLRAHGGDVSCISFRTGPHGENEMATASSDGTVRVWSVPGCEQMYEFASDEDEALCCAYHPDPNQNLLVCGYRSGALRVFDVCATALIYEYKQHVGAVYGVGIHANGHCVFSLGDDGHICVYDSSQFFQPTKMIPLDEAGTSFGVPKIENKSWSPKCMALDPTGKLLAAVHPIKQEIVLVNTKPGLSLVDMHVVMQIKRASRSFGREAVFLALTFSSDGTELIASTADNRIIKYRILYSSDQGWDATLVRDTHSMHPASVSALALSPHGSDYLATSGSDNMLQIWDARLSGAAPTLQRFIGHASEVLDSNFSQDGRFFASVGRDQTMLLWEFLGEPSENPWAAADDIAIGCITSGQNQECLVDELTFDSQTEITEEGMKYHPSLEEVNTMRHAEVTGLNVVGTSLSPASPLTTESSTSIAWADGSNVKFCPPRRQLAADDTENLKAARCIPTHTDSLRVTGLNISSASVMGWHPSSGLFVYTCGRHVIFEDLSSQAQETFVKHHSTVSAVTVGASGRYVATGAGLATAGGAAAASGEGKCAEIIIYEAADNICVLHVMIGHLHAGVQALQFSSDEKRLASLGAVDNGMLCVWDVEHGTLQASHRLVDGIAFDLLWSSLSSLVTVGLCGQLAFWDVPAEHGSKLSLDTIQHLRRLNDDGTHLTCVARAPRWLTRAHEADCVFAIGDTHGEIYVMALPERIELARWQAAEDEVTAIAWCEKHIVVGVCTGVVVLWDVSEEYPDAGCIPAHVFSYKNPIVDLCWQAQGNDGLVATAASSCIYTSVVHEQLVPILRGHEHPLDELCISSNGSLLATCSKRSTSGILLWEPSTMEVLAQVSIGDEFTRILSVGFLHHPEDAMHAVPSFLNTPTMCVLGCSDGSLRVVDFASSGNVSSMQVFAPSDSVVSVCAIGSWIAAASCFGEAVMVRVNLENGTLDESIRIPVSSQDHSKGGRAAFLCADTRMLDIFAVADKKGTVTLFELGAAHVEPVLKLSQLDFKFVGFANSDSDVLICATENSVCQIAFGVSPDASLSEEVLLPPGELITALAGDLLGTDRGRVLRFVNGTRLEIIYDGHISAVSSLVVDLNKGLVFSASDIEVVRSTIIQ